MLCQECLEKVISKLQPNDLVVLEHLNNSGAITPQFSLSKKTIQEEISLSIHCATGSLLRLEILGMIDLGRGTKASKYYITESGKVVLNLIVKKLEDFEKIS